MEKKKDKKPEDIKPDLKHDSMEYSASTDGDDILEINNDPLVDDDGISSEELEIIEGGSDDEEAAALVNVEIDREADNDVNFDENDVDDDWEDNPDMEDEEDNLR